MGNRKQKEDSDIVVLLTALGKPREAKDERRKGKQEIVLPMLSQGTYYTCERCYQVDRSCMSMRLELRRKV